jgi:hypothetical protein
MPADMSSSTAVGSPDLVPAAISSVDVPKILFLSQNMNCCDLIIDDS